MLNKHNTVIARSGALYANATGVSLGPPESSTQMASRSLQPFLQCSLGDRPTDRPTDHATQSVTIGGAHSGEAKFCYCLWPQQVLIGTVDSNTPSLTFLRKRSPELVICRLIYPYRYFTRWRHPNYYYYYYYYYYY